MEEATGCRVAIATHSLCDTQERLLRSRNISDSSSSILAAPLGSFFTDFVAELSFPLWYFRKVQDKVTKSHPLLISETGQEQNVQWLTFLVGSQRTVVLTSLFAYQFISQSRFCPFRAPENRFLNHFSARAVINKNKPAWLKERWTHSNQLKLKYLWWMSNDVVLCLKKKRKPSRLCLLSQSMEKLKKAGAQHGWVRGQGVMYCAQHTEVPESIRCPAVGFQVKVIYWGHPCWP